jgi:hypothetical protein
LLIELCATTGVPLPITFHKNTIFNTQNTKRLGTKANEYFDHSIGLQPLLLRRLWTYHRLSPQQSLITHIKAPVSQKHGLESEKDLLPLATDELALQSRDLCSSIVTDSNTLLPHVTF